MGKVCVYLDDGRVFSYQVENSIKGREHCFAIASTGYRHAQPGAEGYLEHYPAHRISKVVYRGKDVDSKYLDEVSGT